MNIHIIQVSTQACIITIVVFDILLEGDPPVYAIECPLVIPNAITRPGGRYEGSHSLLHAPHHCFLCLSQSPGFALGLEEAEDIVLADCAG